MSEVKRLNRLWSNESLYLRKYAEIPIYDDDLKKGSALVPTNVENDLYSKELKKCQDIDEESFQDIFRRIDMNIRKTKGSVHRLTESST